MRKSLLLMMILLVTCVGVQPQGKKRLRPKARTTAATANCTTSTPCSLLGITVPAGSASASAQDERGMRFTSDAAGTVVGIKFYKVAGDAAATHKVNLWSASCANLGSVSTSSETATGWQTATFPSPIPISAGTYIASYGTSSLITAVSRYFFTTSTGAPMPLDVPPLHAGAANGTLAYNAIGTCPVGTAYQHTNYWVDVLFVSSVIPPAPPVITTQPQNETVAVGQVPSFAVVAAGTGLSYQWQKNGVAIAGATGATYAGLPTTQADVNSSFTVVVSNSQGSVTSSPAVLTVTPITGHLDSGQTTVLTWNAADVLLGQCGTTASCTSSIVSSGTASVTFSIKIAAANALAITTTSLPNGTCGQAYSATLAANGGTPPYSWSIIAGALPPNLALNASTGVISGTIAPCTTGSQNSVTFQVKDTAGLMFQRTLAVDPHRYIRQQR